MRPSLAIVIFLLPFTALALYDESSTRKVKLEDIEDEHLQSERRSKSGREESPSLPPPLSRQPAKGQPTKTYPPIDHVQETPSTTHRYSTRAQHNVRPLADQPTAPEADYQQSPAYQHETIVYYPNHAHGQPPQQQQFDVTQQQQQPSPVFYYSHDLQQPTGNGYQVQFVPLGQHGGPDEQHAATGHGPQGTVQQGTSVVSYSHDAAFGGAQPAPVQQQYNDIQEPNNAQQVYGLPGNLLFQSQKDIEYAKPANAYGPPPRSQQPYSNRQEEVEFTQPEVTYSHQDERQRQPDTYHQKDIEYAQQVDAEIAQKPAITYGPPDTVGQTPQIEYGVPDAPFRRPQSNQNAYAPQRPDSSSRANEKPFPVSFPYPPSFVSITTRRPFYEKPTPAPETSYNEIPQWQTNVMPLNLIPPSQETQYRSFGPAAAPTASPQHIELQAAPLVDIFNNRHAKSLLDSYVPSWLVARMQEDQARQLHQQQHQPQQHQYQHQQAYAIPSPASEAGYNTIAYSTQFENIYGRNLKRSIQRSKGNQKKKATLPQPTTTA